MSSSTPQRQQGSSSGKIEKDKGSEAISMVPESTSTSESIRSNKSQSVEGPNSKSGNLFATDLNVNVPVPVPVPVPAPAPAPVRIAEGKAEIDKDATATATAPKRNLAVRPRPFKRSRVSNISEAKISAFSDKVHDSLQLFLTPDIFFPSDGDGKGNGNGNGKARDMRARKMIDELTTSEINNLNSMNCSMTTKSSTTMTNNQSAEPKHGMSTSTSINKANPANLVTKYKTEGGVLFL